MVTAHGNFGVHLVFLACLLWYGSGAGTAGKARVDMAGAASPSTPTVVIDGSILEGGGQILRTSVALATLLRVRVGSSPLLMAAWLGLGGSQRGTI